MILEIKELNIYMNLEIEKEKYNDEKYTMALFDSILNIIGQKTFYKYRYCIADRWIDSGEIIRTFYKYELLNWFNHKKSDRYKVIKVLRNV